MTKSGIILFILGLIAELIGFVSGNAEDLPFAMSLSSPAYFRAQTAITKLKSNVEISSSDIGFEELGEVLLQPLRKNNPPKIFEKISLVQIRPKKLSTVRLTGVIQQFDLGVVAVFSNDQQIDYLLSAITPQIEKIKRRDLLRLAIGVFAFGIILQILGFAIEWRASGRSAT